ncbi:MAG: hypothetical protein SGCHY_004986 [Lobulomycetales sp.]
MTKTVIVRDYAFAETDPRFRGIHSTPEEIERQLIKDRSVSPSVSGPNKQTSHSYLQNKHIFSNPEKHSPTIPVLRKLSAILHKTDAVDDGFRFVIRHAKAESAFKKVSDWEMSLENGQRLVRILREPTEEAPVAGERWASVDELGSEAVEPPTNMINLYLDPGIHWREFVEYQKVYGPEWCTVCDLNTLKQENSILVQIRAIGLVPVEAITEIGPDAL